MLCMEYLNSNRWRIILSAQYATTIFTIDCIKECQKETEKQQLLQILDKQVALLREIITQICVPMPFGHYPLVDNLADQFLKNYNNYENQEFDP